MRYIFTLAGLLLLLLPGAQAQPFGAQRGYIVTKNNRQLTGYIGQIVPTQRGLAVEYTNDFGTHYELHPLLIRGFVFFEGPAVYAYESKHWRGRWMYLLLRFGGRNIKLFQSPGLSAQYQQVNGEWTVVREAAAQYWIEVGEEGISPIRRINFRHQMRELTQEVAPQLSKKIGQRGYRFNDLINILAEYDKEAAKKKRQL